jgi:hypothetical protein
LQRIWKEVVVAQSRYYPSICPEGETVVRTAAVLAEVRTEYIPNTTLERYRYAHLLDRVMVWVHVPTYPKPVLTSRY